MIDNLVIPKASDDSNFTIYTSGSYDSLLMKQKGLGSPPTRIMRDDYPIKHGGKLISQYYQKRRIVLSGLIFKTTQALFLSHRRDLVDAFTFNNAEKTMVITLLDSTVIQLDVIGISELRIAQKGVMAEWEIELEANDPLLYGNTLNSDIGYVTTIEGGVAIPATIPLELSGGISNELEITNSGNAQVFPSSFQIYGPGTDFVIKNRTVDESLCFDDEITDGNYIDINFKERTALLNGVTNAYGDISGDFWKIKEGVNVITLTVGSGNEAGTRIEIAYRDGYWGVQE